MASLFSFSSSSTTLSDCSPSSTTSKRETLDLTGSVFLISSDGRTINLPIPTNSALDPLNWSHSKRAGAFLALLFSSIAGISGVQCASLMFKPLSLEFSANVSLTALLAAPTLFMGLGAFLWIPLSLAIGRRPVMLLASFSLIPFTLWAGVSRNFYSLLAAQCCQGFATGAWTSMSNLVIIDLTFIHQRPQAIAMIWSLGGAIDLLILAFVPYMTDSATDWRMVYLLWLIPSTIAFALIFFFLPETYFIRPAVAFDGRIIIQSSTEKIKLYESWEEVPGGKALPDLPGKYRDLRIWGTTRGGWRAMLACYPQILLCFLNPLVFWVTILGALVFGSMISIGGTYAVVLGGPPYTLSIHAIGLVNLAGSVGALLAWPAAGLMIAAITRRLAVKNNGIRDAEYYLPAFILPVLTGAASVILYGLTIRHEGHWMWIYFSYTLNCFSFASLAAANILWVTEAFPRWAAPAIVVVSGVSYMASFGISATIIPWVKSQGYAGANLQIGGMILGVGFVAIPICFWGKKLRQYIDGRWAVNEMGALRPQ
ncbi:major facilitator superfamily transporter [Rhexocercosporidium sp. MPI-PUGE-AT-0058]|nr:major facilitator superfamily transporter [Rhexocercosporidium sp. MPI-PUGE-AT-0058]